MFPLILAPFSKSMLTLIWNGESIVGRGSKYLDSIDLEKVK